MGYNHRGHFQGRTTGGFGRNTFPDLEDNDNVEVWVTGEGKYNDIAYQPGYGEHGTKEYFDVNTSPAYRFLVVENIKYALLFGGFYILNHILISRSGYIDSYKADHMGTIVAATIVMGAIVIAKSLFRIAKYKEATKKKHWEKY